MPLYDWVDKATKKELAVLRTFAEYKTPPTEEEAKEAGFTDEEINKVEWTRLIGTGIQVTRAEGFTGKKGHW